MSDQINSLKEALESNPDNWETRFSLIYALHQDGQTNEAVDILSEITSLPTGDRDIVYAAQSYQVLGASEQAISVYQTALELNPENQAAKAGLESLGVEIPTVQVVEPVPLANPDVADEAETSGSRTVNLEEAARAEAIGVSPDANVSLAEDSPPVKVVPEHALAEGAAPAPVISKDDTIPYDPETAEFVDHIQAAEEESLRRHKAAIARDRVNSVIVTILVHVAIVLVLVFGIVQSIPRSVPPQIVASSSAETNDPALEKQVLKKSSLKANNPADASSADILSVPSVSAISLTTMDAFTGSDVPMETGMTFQPSMSMGMPSDSKSMMMFGQPMEGETLGVVLDVSGSMAEWLPLVIREVDRNFKDAPIVYVTNARMQSDKREVEIRPIVKEEVVPRRADGTHSPFWFLWGDLPRKAPQRSVDRLIETYKTRPNQFIALGENGHWGGGNRLGAAMKFLAKENCDAVYVFSDFEDFIDDEVALEHGRYLSQAKVRAYIQPAVEESEFISVMAKRVANRTKGRQLPTLASVLGGDKPEEPEPLMPPRPTEMTQVPGTSYARPRTEMIGKNFYDFKPAGNWNEITRLEEPEFDAVFYGPQARVAIFLKNNKGEYIQYPIVFGYHSQKYLPDHPDTKYRWRGRKFLRMEEPPKFDGKEIVWKMVLEDELKFHVHLYLGRKGMNATYVAEPPKDGTSDHAYIYFRIPNLARENKDVYYGQDMPEGLKTLDDVRAYAHPNELVMNLPRQERKRFADSWAKLGFEPGYNTRTFDTLITRMPSGIRDMKISGPSFAERVINARTTSSKILLHGGAWRGDSEPWEGFHARLSRSADTREKFTKTEAIEINIE